MLTQYNLLFISYSSDTEKANLILICVGFLSKSFLQRYILHFILFKYTLQNGYNHTFYLQKTVLISQFSPEREGGWEPDRDVGKNQDKNPHMCHCL